MSGHTPGDEAVEGCAGAPTGVSRSRFPDHDGVAAPREWFRYRGRPWWSAVRVGVPRLAVWCR